MPKTIKTPRINRDWSKSILYQKIVEQMDGKKSKDDNLVLEYLLDNPNKLDVFSE